MSADRLERVVVAIDFSEGSDRALAAAIRFAKGLGAAVDLVHVYPLPGTGVVRPSRVWCRCHLRGQRFSKVSNEALTNGRPRPELPGLHARPRTRKETLRTRSWRMRIASPLN